MNEVLVAFALLVLLLVVLGSLAYGAFSAAPWVPLWHRDVVRLLELLQLKPGEVFIDLGCGDGRIVELAARRYGVHSIGYEVALLPYALAWVRCVLSPARQNIELRLASFWSVDLSQADAIGCFLTPAAMRQLEPKLARELKPGARFATYAFRLPTATPTKSDKPLAKLTTIYVYTEIVQPILPGV